MFVLSIEQRSKDGFRWFYPIKKFTTRKAAELYKRLHYKHSAREVRIERAS